MLAREGHEVHIIEKNDEIGGRARKYEADGFVFDMGPSWYWMPDVFEQFFQQFGKSTSDYYELKELSPGFSIFFGPEEIMDIPSNYDELLELFESIETGAADKLKKFMDGAEYKYQVGINDLVYKPSLSWTEFVDLRLVKGLFKLQVFNSFKSHVRSYFKDPRLVALMEFPVLFLGALPSNTPALYSLMNYAALKLGTWYPMGGFNKIAEALKDLAVENGVHIHTGSAVDRMSVVGNQMRSISANGKSLNSDAVLATADYHHIETDLLDPEYRSYTEKYWDSRTLAPSCLIFYLGIDRKIPKLRHHNLFFDTDFEVHAHKIYTEPSWPEDPLFYACCPSKTDPSVAPEDHENLFLLVPIAPNIEDTDEIREHYFEKLMDRLKASTGVDLRSHIVHKRGYCVKDFKKDYNSYKGNAYGLANTLRQTALLKPSLRSKKINNLFYAGQLTVPGPGVPPAIISGQVAARQILNQFR